MVRLYRHVNAGQNQPYHQAENTHKAQETHSQGVRIVIVALLDILVENIRHRQNYG